MRAAQQWNSVLAGGNPVRFVIQKTVPLFPGETTQEEGPWG